MTTETTAQPGAGVLRPSDIMAASQAAEEVTNQPEGEEAAAEEPKPDPEPQDDLSDGDGEDDGVDAAEEEPQPRKGKTAKERIQELNAKAREKEREAEYWRGVAEGRIKPQAEAEPEAAAVPEPNAGPDPADFEYGESDPKYILARAKFEARQEYEEQRERESIEREIAELETGWKSRVETAKETYPDFDEKVTARAERGEWPCPPLIALGIKQSEVGDHVAYHLATNLEEATRIAALPDILQAREFGRLEGKFLNAPQAPARKVTKAPEPPTTLSRGTSGRFENPERSLYRKMLQEFK